MSGPELAMWVITADPSDYPGRFVARRHVVGKGATAEHIVSDTLEEIRAMIPPGLICLPRDPGDDPVIVESWI